MCILAHFWPSVTTEDFVHFCNTFFRVSISFPPLKVAVPCCTVWVWRIYISKAVKFTFADLQQLSAGIGGAAHLVNFAVTNTFATYSVVRDDEQWTARLMDWQLSDKNTNSLVVHTSHRVIVHSQLIILLVVCLLEPELGTFGIFEFFQ